MVRTGQLRPERIGTWSDMNRVVRNYAASVLLTAVAAGLVYSWVTTGHPMAFVYYRYPILLSGVAAALVIMTFFIACVATGRPRSASLVTVAGYLVLILALVTATAEGFLDQLWWRVFIFYSVFVLIPPIVAAISTSMIAARGSRPNRRG
ncbi:hypothetical protein GCM10009625_01950 [Brachybacterium fresconis]